AKERGIVVTNTPDVLTDATADIAFLLILSVSRRAWEAENFMREGRFAGWLPDLFLGVGLQGKLLGILGYGRIGSAVARRGRAFGMRIAYHARNRLPREREVAESIEYLPLDRLIAQSDILSLHMPYTPASRHLIGAKALDSMRPTAILINTARGPLVDETALLSALKERRIFGAGFDVYEHEPRVDPALLDLPNVSVLPHIGSATIETRAAMAAMAIDDCVAVLTGAAPRHRVV
ncbi:MAG TPA: D-glycerate dehydrogenase, partial [bacterium]|nr:D-glycerate dehydrogenase [bacterium]